MLEGAAPDRDAQIAAALGSRVGPGTED
jgi:hypothetical protein